MLHARNTVSFVPSEKTADALKNYDKRAAEEKPEVIVIPYPISPYMGKNLSSDEFEKRVSQLNPKSTSAVNMMIPLSGAAVGMREFAHFMTDLHQINNRFTFQVIVKNGVWALFCDS